MGTYTIEAKAKYFKDRNQAMQFFKELILLPYETALNKINRLNYQDYLEASMTTTQYDTQIEFLLLQKNLLENGYDSLIEIYGDGYINDRKISMFIIELEKFFIDNNVYLLDQELEFCGYVKNFERYESQLLLLDSKLLVELEDNNKVIDRLNEQIKYLLSLASQTGANIQILESYNKAIAEKIIRNAAIERERIAIATKLNSASLDTSDFDYKLNFFTMNLERLTISFTDVIKETFKQETKITFYSNSIIIEVDKINPIVAGLIASIIGGIIVSIAVVITEASKAKKKELI